MTFGRPMIDVRLMKWYSVLTNGKEGFTMARKITGRPGLFGDSVFYEDGRRVGRGRPKLFGGSNYYDSDGRKVGENRPGIFSSQLYDAKGHRIGESRPGIFGGTVTRLKDRK